MRKVILCVTNDLENDQRVNRSALTLHEAGYNVLVVGRLLPRSSNFEKPYATHRFRLLFRRSMLFYTEYNFRLFLFLLFRKCNLLISNDIDTLPACWLASRLKRQFLVFDSHELFTEVPELVGRHKTKKIWAALENFLIPRIDKGITVCEPIAEIYQQKYKKQFEVVRNVPLPKFFDNNPEKDSVSILYQGAVNKGRGLELLIESMIYLPEVTLIIAGSGDLLEAMKVLVKEKELTKKITFIGHVPYGSLHEITRKATVGVSLEEDIGLNYRFALPNKIFDYIQAGVPVVVSNLPVMAGLVTEYKVGEVLLNRHPEILAQTLRTVIAKQQTGYYSEYLKNAANSLNWDNEKKKFLSIFADLT
jgi:glycosyltransferase involved in cell wall biosynthesis